MAAYIPDIRDKCGEILQNCTPSGDSYVVWDKWDGAASGLRNAEFGLEAISDFRRRRCVRRPHAAALRHFHRRLRVVFDPCLADRRRIGRCGSRRGGPSLARIPHRLGLRPGLFCRRAVVGRQRASGGSRRIRLGAAACRARPAGLPRPLLRTGGCGGAAVLDRRLRSHPGAGRRVRPGGVASRHRADRLSLELDRPGTYAVPAPDAVHRDCRRPCDEPCRNRRLRRTSVSCVSCSR